MYSGVFDSEECSQIGFSWGTKCKDGQKYSFQSVTFHSVIKKCRLYCVCVCVELKAIEFLCFSVFIFVNTLS